MKKFQRRKENFKCEKCGTDVQGNGYTDHCPNCLWSKHVDVNPGDRASDCGGQMQPVGVEIKEGEYKILYRCNRCRFVHNVKALPEDNFEEILKLSKQQL